MIPQNFGNLNVHKQEDLKKTEYITIKPAEEFLSLQVQLLDAIEQSVFASDLGGIVIYWNRFAEQLYGWSTEEAMGRHIMELTTPKPSVRQADEIMSQLRQGKSWTGEFTAQRKDGTTFPAQITNSPIYDNKQRLIGIIALSNNITERNQAEERLEQSEGQLQNIFEASHDGILVENNERISYINKSYVHLFGYDDHEELIGQHISTVISSEDVERVIEYGRRRLRGEQPPTRYEFKGKRKDGTSVDIEASVSTSKTVNNTYVTTIIRDITERKRMEILIEAQKQSLEMVVKGAPLPEVLVYLTQIVEQQTEGQTVASILLLDAQGYLHNGASPNLSEDLLRAIDGFKADVNVGTCIAAAASRNTVITPDIAADPNWQGLAYLPLEQGFKAVWTMPIMARDGHVLGTFGTYFREQREPTAIERQVVEILGRTAALAIEGKQTEEILRSNENQLRLITDTVPLLVSYVDREHRYRFVNRTYTEWFGRSREEVIGKHLSEVLGQAAYQTILPEVEKVLSGEEVVFERLVPYKNGERFIHLNYIPEFDTSTELVTGFHAFVQDITERKQAEEGLRRSQEELEVRVQERTKELEKANKERVGILHQLVTAQEGERKRIARELHDQLGQEMTVLRLKLDILKKVCADNEELRRQVDEIQKVARQLDLEVDFLAWKMRPTVLDDVGIVAALDQFVRQWSAHFNIPADFDAKRFSKTRLAPEVETNFYRIAQEALNNIYKHAQASRVNVSLEPRNGDVVLIIEDNGIGFEPDEQISIEKGMGIVGMGERAALIGGKLEIESTAGVGTTIYVSVPVSKGRKEKNG
jgi:PAS domain S-box-containing protein